MNLKVRLAKVLAAFGAIALMSQAHGNLEVTGLRCEYLQNPLGVGELHPRLSWVLRSDQRGERQTAYQVVVASDPNKFGSHQGELWNTGKISSDQSNKIEYAGTPLLARASCFWKVRTWDSRGRVSPWSPIAHWTVGLLSPDDWHSDWIGLVQPEKNENGLATPRYLRRSFTAKAAAIKRATLYVTALGLYEIHLNGRRVSDHLLAPEWTNYFKRVQYQTFDVTSLMRPGQNALGAILGNGWYCGDWQHWESKLRPIYGDQPYLRLQLEIEAADGTTQTIGSSRNWKGTTDGPLRFSGIYEGETCDGRKEMPGWDTPIFDDRKWQRVFVATPKVGSLEWQRSEPIRITQLLKPRSISEPRPGVYVFDMGQNMAGWCRMRLRQPSGTQVTFQFNEMLNPDGTVYMDNLHAGHLSQGDRQIDRYTCLGNGWESFEPHFTYHGFRYVQISGLKSKPSLESLTGCVFHTAFHQTGSFSCSEPLLNRLAANIQWSQRANMMGVPTDCCQRDERCGYTGDAQFFMPTAVYNFDVAAFSNKWLQDLCEDSQLPEGSFADHAPTFGPGDHWNVGWSDAGILCPYIIWQTYGDTRVIRDHYEAMRKNMALLKATSPTYIHTAAIGNGDWLNLGGGAPDALIGTAYDAYDSRLMAEMAQAIGKAQDAADFASQADHFRTAFVRGFLGQGGKLKDSSQTGYALAYTMGLVPEDQKAKMALCFGEEINRFGGHLATGFIGTPRLLPALHQAGRDDLAYQILLQQTYPSWLYQVKLGATTMWERWDGWRPEKGFQDSGMNSFNHYAFGSVGEYLFGMIGGIQSESPGYKRIRIAPVIRPALTWAKTSFQSIQGNIVSNWKREPNKLTLEIEVPVNAVAEIYIPTNNPSMVTESGKLIAKSRDLKFVRMENGCAVVQVGSGHFRFSSPTL